MKWIVYEIQICKEYLAVALKKPKIRVTKVICIAYAEFNFDKIRVLLCAHVALEEGWEISTHFTNITKLNDWLA